MNNNKLKIFIILKLIILSTIFYGGIYFENAQSSRLLNLTIIFVFYIIVGLLRNFLFKNKKLYKLSFILDIMLIYFLEHNSRFLINYFFHSFYIVVLLEISLFLNKRSSIYIGITTVIISLIKYLTLIYYRPNLKNISEMAFFTLINTFVLVVTNLSQYYKSEKEDKEELYKELLKAHRELREYANEIEKLTIVKERNRIARDLHDTLGHSITGTIMEMEMAYHLLEEDSKGSKELISKSIISMRDGLKKIREVVETLKNHDNISVGLNSIEKLIDDFSNKTKVNIKLNVKGKVVKTRPSINIVIYRTIQEALTNSVRHGCASNVIIELIYLEDKIEFFIRDNGKGCEFINKGHGLKGMKERITDVKGQVKFSSKQGFIIEGCLPLL